MKIVYWWLHCYWRVHILGDVCNYWDDCMSRFFPWYHMYPKCYVIIDGGGLIVTISEVRTLNGMIQRRLPIHRINLGHFCTDEPSRSKYQWCGPAQVLFDRGGLLISNGRCSHQKFDHDILEMTKIYRRVEWWYQALQDPYVDTEIGPNMTSWTTTYRHESP